MTQARNNTYLRIFIIWVFEGYVSALDPWTCLYPGMPQNKYKYGYNHNERFVFTERPVLFLYFVERSKKDKIKKSVPEDAFMWLVVQGETNETCYRQIFVLTFDVILYRDFSVFHKNLV